MLSILERSLKGETYAPCLCARTVVGEAMIVVNAEEFPQIAQTHIELYIGCPAIHNLCNGLILSGTVLHVHPFTWHVVEEFVTWVGQLACLVGITAGVVEPEGVVLVGEITPHHVETDILTPLKFLDERYAIEQLTIKVPAIHKSKRTVVEELHIADKRECIVVSQIAGVGLWQAEQLEGNGVPLDHGAMEGVYTTP